MKEIVRQFLTIWKELRSLQKSVVIGTLVFVIGMLFYLILNASSSHLTPLYPSDRLLGNALAEVRFYLETKGIAFEEKENTILVPAEIVQKIRMEIAAAGILKHDVGKGFELFDSNTWIKGEKELQVLEMRALKGQLEQDIAEYENVKNASVILDLAPPRPFGGTQYKTKASIILTLMPGARLKRSQLRAITYHLAGAVRGLEPQMIAISDTSGKLYQAIEAEGQKGYWHEAQMIIEDEILEKIEGVLAKVAGQDFYATLQVHFENESEKIVGASVAVFLDTSLVTLQKPYETWIEEIDKSLKIILEGHGISDKPSIEFIEFRKNTPHIIKKDEKIPVSGMIFTIGVFICSLLAIYPLFKRYSKKTSKQSPAPPVKSEKPDEELFHLMTHINVEKLTRSIEKEDPATIALMLSYLEPERAEQIIAALPENIQEAVLIHLSLMENEES